MDPDCRPVRRARARLLAALVASAALHLLVLAFLALLASPPPAARRQAEPVPLEVELRPFEPPASPPPSPQPSPPAARRERETPRGNPASAARPPSTPAAGATAARAPPDLAAEGLAPSPRDGVPDLRVRPLSGLPVASADPAAEAPKGAAASSPSPALDAWLEDHAGRARVEGGLVHPWHRGVGRALAKAWKAEPALDARGVSGRLSQLGDNLLTFVKVWQRLAEGYAATGAPALLDGASDRVKALAGLPPGPARDALVAAELDRQLRPAFSEGHVALVRVTQAADGHLLSVALVSPSKDAELDRAALEAVRSTVGSVGAPPPEALGGREKLVSTWEFRLDISIMPPVPAVGLEFDEVLGVGQLRLPLGRRVWKEVRLVALN